MKLSKAQIEADERERKARFNGSAAQREATSQEQLAKAGLTAEHIGAAAVPQKVFAGFNNSAAVVEIEEEQ